MNALLISLCVAAIIALYYCWSFTYWKKKGVKTLRPNLLFGNLSNVLFGNTPAYKMFSEVYKTCKKSGDKFMGFYFLNQPALVVVDPELVKNILVKDFNSFTNRPFYIDENDPFTIHLASARGAQWKKMREQLSKAFSPSKLKNLCHTLQKVNDQLIAVLDKSAENSEVIDLKDMSSKFIVDTIGMSVFGIECNTLQNSNIEFLDNAEKILAGSFIQTLKLAITMLCPSIMKLFKIPFIGYDLQKFYLNLVKTTVEHREKNNIVRKDLMHTIIQLRNNVDVEEENNSLISSDLSKTEKSLKIEEITAHAVIFFGGAYETSSITISLCIYELAMNENIQNNLREEIISVLAGRGEKATYDDILKMTYLEKCVLETIRKYGIVSILARTCTEKYQFPNSDVVLDVGNELFIPICEFQSDPDYYPNPDEFDPERFSPENKSKRPNYTFLSLGDGPRSCIGARLGLLKVKMFLITLLSNYNFSINSKTELPVTFSKTNVVVCPDKPLYLNVQKIQTTTTIL